MEGVPKKDLAKEVLRLFDNFLNNSVPDSFSRTLIESEKRSIIGSAIRAI
jgi:hypothetical protein